MNIDMNILFGAGMNIFLVGVLILAFGFKKRMSLTEFMNLGPELMTNLDQYFRRWSIIVAKVLWFFGMTLVLISIALILFETF